MARLYGAEDAAYLRALEEERIDLVGATCAYYSLNRGAHVDAGYNEPTNDPLYGGAAARGTPQISEQSWNFYPNATEPDLAFACAFEYVEADARTPSVRDEGFVVDWEAIVYIARDAWECAIQGTRVAGRLPKEGDVLYVNGEWWDVVNAGRSGYVVNTAEYVGFKLQVAKRSRFTPDRKVDR